MIGIGVGFGQDGVRTRSGWDWKGRGLNRVEWGQGGIGRDGD